MQLSRLSLSTAIRGYFSKDRLRENSPIIVLIVVSTVARLLFLGSKSLWVDESYAAAVAGAGWNDLSRLAAASTPHPPCSFALMKLSSILFGYTEFGLRLLPALLGASAVFPVFRFARRRFGAVAAFWAGMLWALVPWGVSLGQELWVYGTLAALTFWSIDFADMVWHGNKKAIIGFLLFSIAGLYTQHLFVLVVISGCLLYFTVRSDKRPSIKIPVLLALLLLLIYYPLFLSSIDGFITRNSRLSGQGLDLEGFRTQFLGIITQLTAGGLLPSDPKLLFYKMKFQAWVIGAVALLILGAFISSMFDKKISISFRLWMLCVLCIPFLISMRELPSARQLSLSWIAFIPAFSSLFRRVKWSGALITAFCVFGLTFYYPLTSHPYHRSDWKQAASIVNDEWEDTDGVFVSGGKFGGLAWGFYNTEKRPFYPFNGLDPFSETQQELEQNGLCLVDSLLTEHDRLWIVTDNWGPMGYLPYANYCILNTYEAGDEITIMLIQE